MLVGCMGVPVSDIQAMKITPGVTTKQQLLKEFGIPRYSGIDSTTSGTKESADVALPAEGPPRRHHAGRIVSIHTNAPRHDRNKRRR
jgi:hypothetical protein